MKLQNRLITLTTLLLCACGVAAGNPDRPTGKLHIDKRYPPAATAGTPLTLEGRNFGAEQGTVRIGGQSVNVLSWSADKVVVETPSSETTACESVRVFSADGVKSNVVPFAYGNRDLWIPNSDVPAGRLYPLSVWTGEEMIVWGGETNTGGRYNPLTDTWLPISTIGALVPDFDFFGQGAAFWTGKIMLVFSNNGAGKYDPELDTWTVIPIDGPVAFGWGTSAVWTGQEMIVWGENGGARFDPVTDRWSPMSGTIDGDGNVSKTLARGFHTAVWTGSEMIIWGGTGGRQDALGNGARYNPKTDRWTPISLASAPSARSRHQAVWTGDEMLVWGGADKGILEMNLTVETSGARYNPRTNTWSPISTTDAPLGGVGAVTVWTGDEWVIYGGQVSHFLSGSIAGGASYNPRLNQWRQLPTVNQPGGRAYSTAVWTGSDLILWGGLDENRAMGEIGARFNVKFRKWAPIAGVVGQPQQRAGFSVIWTGAEMVVWGGYSSHKLADNDTGGRYDPVMNQWRPISPAPSSLGRAFHEAVWTGSQMLITPEDDLPGLLYRPETDQWTIMSMAGAPTVGSFPGAIWTGEKMIVWGASTGGMYDPLVNGWYPMNTTGAPPYRRFTRPVWTGTEMLIYGGGDMPALSAPNGGFNSGGRFNPATNEWTSLPKAEFLHIGAENSTIWTGDEFLIVGTHTVESNSPFEAQGGRFDPDTNTWKQLNLTNAPISYSPSAVWNGREMLVFSEPAFDFQRRPRPITGFKYSLEKDEWSSVRCGCSAYNPDMFKLRFVIGAQQKAVWTGSTVQIWGVYGGFTYQP